MRNQFSRISMLFALLAHSVEFIPTPKHQRPQGLQGRRVSTTLSNILRQKSGGKGLSCAQVKRQSIKRRNVKKRTSSKASK